jgi:HAMP domain-containing protein
MINTMTQSTWRRVGFISLRLLGNTPSLRNSGQNIVAGTWRHKVMQRLWKSAAYWLAS